MYMVLCVIDQVDHLSQVLNTWRENGVTGVTILDSTGLRRLIQQPHIPMRYAIGNTSPEKGNYTLFTVVEDDIQVRQCLEATESVVGDMNQPNTGIFIAWPVSFVKGVSGEQPER